MSFKKDKYYKLTNLEGFIVDNDNIQIANFIKSQVFKVEKLSGGAIKAISIDGQYYNCSELGFVYEVFATSNEYSLFTEVEQQKNYCIVARVSGYYPQFFDTLKECQDEIRTKQVPTEWFIYKLTQKAEFDVVFNDA